MNPQGFTKIIPKYIKAHRITGDAVIPCKAEGHEGDVGFDITLIGRTENRAEDELNKVNMFHTGLQLKPPEGYYLEMFVRSSLHKQGYSLITGTSIIDPEYRGELLVPLYKFSDQEDLDLPFVAVQLVLKEQVACHMAEEAFGFDQTNRGAGGFGSTGQHAARSDPNKLGYMPQGQPEQYLARPQQGQRRPVAKAPQNQFF